MGVESLGRGVRNDESWMRREGRGQVGDLCEGGGSVRWGGLVGGFWCHVIRSVEVM